MNRDETPTPPGPSLIMYLITFNTQIYIHVQNVHQNVNIYQIMYMYVIFHVYIRSILCYLLCCHVMRVNFMHRWIIYGFAPMIFHSYYVKPYVIHMHIKWGGSLPTGQLIMLIMWSCYPSMSEIIWVNMKVTAGFDKCVWADPWADSLIFYCIRTRHIHISINQNFCFMPYCC